MNTVHVLSGGLDSTTLLYDLLSQGDIVHCLSFNYGQRHSRELEAAVATCNKLKVPHKVVDISGVKGLLSGSALTSTEVSMPEGHYSDESMKRTVVPNRNMILLSLGIGYAVSLGADRVSCGVHLGDYSIYPDCRPEFIDALSMAAKVGNYKPIGIHAPYTGMLKRDIVKRGLKLNVDFSLTWTCYYGGEKACGRCGSCRERLEAFEVNNAVDPLSYEET
jgi:7-cyano-7-deazaguanine synthase